MDKKQSHILALQEKHDYLNKIIEEQYRSYDDDTAIKKNKLRKLQLKAEIEKLRLMSSE